MPWKYKHNGRELTQEEWDALPKRMDWSEGQAPYDHNATWDPKSTIPTLGRECATWDEWQREKKARGLVEYTKAELRDWPKLKKPRPKYRDSLNAAREKLRTRIDLG